MQLRCEIAGISSRISKCEHGIHKEAEVEGPRDRDFELGHLGVFPDDRDLDSRNLLFELRRYSKIRNDDARQCDGIHVRPSSRGDHAVG